jgi:hypothetical protein
MVLKFFDEIILTEFLGAIERAKGKKNGGLEKNRRKEGKEWRRKK